MVGGDAAVLAEVRPVLDAVGKTIVHVGPSGSGQTVKAANQLIVAGTIELVAEALIFLEPTASTPRRPSRCSPVASRATGSSNARPRA